MRTLNHIQMLREYNIVKLDDSNEKSRQAFLQNLPFSVLVEASHDELDSLNYWLRNGLDMKTLNWLYYGKIGYDFGIAEYFFHRQETADSVANDIPRIFTTRKDAYLGNKIFRSNGYDEIIDYNQSKFNAIVIPPQEIK